MPSNKYEQRSTDVQEVMRKPPHSLITWGNTIILLILIIGIWLLSIIKLPDKITIPFQLIEIPSINVSGKIFALNINSNFSPQIKNHQSVSITFESYPSNIYGTIKTEIDTIVEYQNKKCIVLKSFETDLKKNNSNKIILQPTMLGNATIKIGNTNLIIMIKKRKLF